MSSSPAEVLKAATSLFAFAADQDEPQVAESLKAATAVTALGVDASQENTNPGAALQAATAVVALGSDSTKSLDSWTKNAIIKLKTNTDTDKSELQRLNIQLHDYLENVKMLEQLNKALISQVDKAKEAFAPKLFDRSKFDPELSKLRVKLEEESNDCVKYKARIEESENLIQHIGQRIKFYQSDVQADRQKISALELQLAEINNQRDYLLRSSNLAEESIAREKQRIAQAEKDLQNLIKKLRDDRSKNKQIEFEMQTLNDELAFLKAVFQEELNDMRLKINGGGLTGSDLTNFYKNELVTAIRQIRDDFNTMNDQQLADYKDHKENELKLIIQQTEKDKQKEQELRSKNEANKDLELQSANELRSSIDGNKKEMGQLNSEFGKLSIRLTQLEDALRMSKNKNQDLLERKLAEIEKLKEQNGSMENEVDYWDRVTRSKLETEIQTYRSILNSQIRLMQSFDDNSNIKIVPSKPPPPRKPSVVNVVVNTITEIKPVQPAKPSGPVEILRQVFDYFDVDRTGRINSSELERVLEKLNVKLTREAYEQILKEGDRDMSRDIDFDEFCKIMLPVLNGKFEEDELYYAFKKFDLDGSGYISVKELRQILSKIGQIYSESQILELITTVAADPTRGLTFTEFSRLMRQPTPSRAELDAKYRERLRLQYEADQRERARLAAEVEARRQAEDRERLRIEAEQRERARLAAEAESRRQAEERERLRLQYEAEQREKARLAAEAEARRQAEERERLRLQYEAEQREKARLAAEAEARRQAQERERLRLEAEQRERARLAAEAEAKRLAEERERERFRLERERIERERLERERFERERLERERIERERLERERIERERREAEKQRQISVLRQVFDYFDKDKTGQIDASEMDAVLLKLGVKLSKEAFDKMLKDSDMDLSGEISFPEFCKLMLPVFTGNFGDSELYYAFKKFDKSGNGYLSVSELRQILAQIGQNFSEREVIEMMLSVGCDISKGLDFQGFAKLMKTPK